MISIKNFIKQDKNTLYKHILFTVLLVFASIFILWKCKFGFGNIDESFYLTIPYRLFKGDALFLHEWHLSQMAGFLTLPIVSAYLLITGGTTGIVLFIRYVCTILQIATAIFVYIRINKINWLGAVVSSLSYVLYVPFGIMALSYNSMGVMTLVISTVIVITAQKNKPLQYIIAGVFYAAAVLCCPYLAIVFALYAVAVLVAKLVRKIKKMGEPEYYLFTVKGLLFLSIGAAIVAVIFAAFVFSRASLSEMMEAFPRIMDDPEHPPVTFFDAIEIYITTILESNAIAKYVYPVLIALACVALADRKRIEHRLSYLLVALIGTVVLMLGYYNIEVYINFMMWSLNMFAFFVVILTKNKTIKNIYYTSWVTGILYSFCLNATSNNRFYIISSGSSVALVGSIVIICIFASELLKETTASEIKNLVIVLISVATVLQIYMQVTLRYKSVFWEVDMESQTTLIEDGFNAGLYVTPEKHQMYYESIEKLKKLEAYDPENVLYLSRNTWYYLIGDYNMATFSAWLSGVDYHSLARLESYFELNPDKKPDVVYVDKAYEAYAYIFAEQFGYTVDYAADDFILVK